MVSVVVFFSALTRGGGAALGGAGRCRRAGTAPSLPLRLGPSDPQLGTRRPLGGRSFLRGFLPSDLGGEAPSAPTWSASRGAAVARSELAPAPGRGPGSCDFAGGLQSDLGSQAPWAGCRRLPAACAFSPNAQREARAQLVPWTSPRWRCCLCVRAEVLQSFPTLCEPWLLPQL